MNQTEMFDAAFLGFRISGCEMNTKEISSLTTFFPYGMHSICDDNGNTDPVNSLL